ncbi:MAG: acyltransferase [Bacteroidetes bacterium]|nr:acyltransferase [Bacteroidota bacterium]
MPEKVNRLKRIPSLDGFRAISIILVLFAHSRFSSGFPQQISSVAQQGAFGVNIFFVISGFLITYLLLKENEDSGAISVKSFYIRRAFRIIPVYSLNILFIFLMSLLISIDVSRGNFLHAITFTSNFDAHNSMVFLHYWSLSVEEQFYLFWPAILIFLGRHLKPIAIAFVLYACVARVISYKFPGHDPVLLAPFFSNSDSIFIGAFGAIIFFEDSNIVKLRIFRSYLAQLAVIGIIILFKYFVSHGILGKISLPFSNTVAGCGVLFLLLCYIEPSESPVYKLLNSRVIVHIGILSYSLYIWQEFFFVEKFNNIFFTFPYNWALIYIVALASYYLWEKPFLKLKDRFHNKVPVPLNTPLAEATYQTQVSKRA